MEEHPENASAPMIEMLSGRVIDSTVLRSLKAWGAVAITDRSTADR